MTREEIICRLYDRFIRPTEQKRESFIGVEIEMPADRSVSESF